jgi:hypothetical protein
MINFVLIPTGSYTALNISQYNPVPSLLVALVHSSLAIMISLGLLSAKAGTEFEQRTNSKKMQGVVLKTLKEAGFTVGVSFLFYH